MLQTVARGTYFGSPGAGAEEGQPLRWRHRSSAARGEPSGSQRSRETTARIRHGCRAHAARRKRQMGEEVGSLSALQGCQRCERTLALFSGLARRGGEPNVKPRVYPWKIPCDRLGIVPISSILPQILPQTSSQTQGNSRVSRMEHQTPSVFPGNFRKRKVLGTLCFPFCFPENWVEPKIGILGPPQAAWRGAVEHPSGGPSAPGRRCWRLGRKRPSPFSNSGPTPLRSDPNLEGLKV